MIEMTTEMLKELAFSQDEIDELNRSREMPITFDEDCPETTPERAVRFYRVNLPNKTVKEESALKKKNSPYENAECGRMARIKELADAADMIVSGYAFTRLPDGYRVINLNRLESVALFSKDGEVIETSMCDIETVIAARYLEKNRKFIDD